MIGILISKSKNKDREIIISDNIKQLLYCFISRKIPLYRIVHKPEKITYSFVKRLI